MEDIHSVLDAVGASRVAVYGVSEGGPLAILFAATYPERVQALVLARVLRVRLLHQIIRKVLNSNQSSS